MQPITLIGLDGATQKVLDPLFANDELPNLAQISHDGFSGTLYSTVPSRTSPAIPALYTGCDPSELGFLGFTKPNGDTITIGDIDLPRLWTILDHHGLRCSVLNVRTTYPPDNIDGIMISGDPAPGEESDYVHPPEIHDEIGGFRAEELDQRRHQDLVPASEYAEEVTDISIKILNRRFETFIQLLEENPPSFNMFWIGGSDFLQHRLWNRRDQIERFYKEADRLIGRVLNIMEGDVFVVSDHGFSTPSEWSFHLNEWLFQSGYLELSGGRIGGQAIRLGQKFARQYVPSKYLRRILQYQSGTADSNPDPPWFDRSLKNIPGVKSSSSAQLVSSFGVDVAEKGAERRQVANDIISGLESLQTPTGKHAIKHAWLAEDIYHKGRYSDDLPDVLFQANDGIAIDPQITNTVFSPHATQRTDHVHAREGIWMGSGPRIEPHAEDIDSSIIDVAPTILHLMEVPVGENMHGSVRSDLLKNDGSPKTEDYQLTLQRQILSGQEQEEMEEWLSDMGYL